MEANPTAPHDPSRRPGTRLRRRPWIVAVGVVASLLAAAIAWHLTAVSAYDAAAASGPTSGRLASAQMAANLEPWNQKFAWRVIALRGLVLLEDGNIDGAYFYLEPYSQIIRDPTYTAIYKAVVKIKTPIDSGKAHVAHGLDPFNNFSQKPTPGTTGSPSPTSTATSATP